MAHSCPDCGQICYCGGDIDDIDFGDDTDEAELCTHCPTFVDDFDECDDDYDDDDGTSPPVITDPKEKT